ncbi:hypothetical protein CH263_22415 [Rhodococcus sp. 06-1059B-a]|nr:hypothetical protein CH263_22415 [Rhodococcus sp. 06-1059B-a]
MRAALSKTEVRMHRILLRYRGAGLLVRSHSCGTHGIDGSADGLLRQHFPKTPILSVELYAEVEDLSNNRPVEPLESDFLEACARMLA